MDESRSRSMTAGSSPLARGLRLPRGHDDEREGIIPARAGFTRPRWCGPVPRPDHPRSRGVYVRACVDDGQPGGSSPLARGLPGRSRPRWCGPGIIPARAGFTTARLTSIPLSSDHPRSRGVYFGGVGKAIKEAGSSPLARGLRCLRHAGEDHVGIIPARAGFTTRCFLTGVPRSGSSPLARGLP